MKRFLLTGLVLVALISLAANQAVATLNNQSKLFTEQEVSPVGLTPCWFNQVSLEADKEQVSAVVLQDQDLFITTESGYLQVIDTQTGTTRWGVQVGSSNYKTFPPSANSHVVVVVNGTTIYAFDRMSGDCLLTSPLYGEPISGPQLSERFIYVPMLAKKIYVLPLRQEIPEMENLKSSLKQMQEVKGKVKFSDSVEEQMAAIAKTKGSVKYMLKELSPNDLRYCFSLGWSLTPLTLCSQSWKEEYVSWTTDEGYLAIGRITYSSISSDLILLYKIAISPQTMYLNERRLGKRFSDVKNEIESSPAFVPKDYSWQNSLLPADRQYGGMLLLGTHDGHVLAVNNATGAVRWKFLADYPISQQIYTRESSERPAAYVPASDGTLYSISLVDGTEIWQTGGVQKILAVSPRCIYAMNQNSEMILLNTENGKRMGTLKIPDYKFKLFNAETDRLFFVSADGLVQCFRETSLVKPVVYRLSSYDIATRLAKEYEGILAGQNPKIQGTQAAQDVDKTHAAAKSDTKPDAKADAKPDAKPGDMAPAAGESKPAKEPA
ncbi:MAG: PQQ-binding-like beta-propeller repeat protein [Thermoguttaceae bacterium]|nr:PQQ-binding-like beta-propeller repeat protein [Thermoguttaceae bacterium]